MIDSGIALFCDGQPLAQTTELASVVWTVIVVHLRRQPHSALERDVCFTHESRHQALQMESLVSANSGHWRSHLRKKERPPEAFKYL